MSDAVHARGDPPPQGRHRDCPAVVQPDKKKAPPKTTGRSQDTLYIAKDIIQHRHKPVDHPVNLLGGAGRYTAIIQAGAINKIVDLLTQRFGIGQSDNPLSQINFTISGGREQLGQSQCGIGSDYQERSDACMAKKERPPITVKAFVKVNGVETDVDTLTPEQKRRLATMINVTLLNVRFAGQAHFYPVEEPKEQSLSQPCG